jgi:hypothetical protein
MRRATSRSRQCAIPDVIDPGAPVPNPTNPPKPSF